MEPQALAGQVANGRDAVWIRLAAGLDVPLEPDLAEERRVGQSQPFSSAVAIASARLRAPSFWITADR